MLRCREGSLHPAACARRHTVGRNSLSPCRFLPRHWLFGLEVLQQPKLRFHRVPREDLLPVRADLRNGYPLVGAREDADSFRPAAGCRDAEQGIFSGGIHVMVEEPVSIRRERDMRGTERNQWSPVAARERPDLGGLLVPSADPVSIRFWDDIPGEGQAGNPLQCRRLLSPDVPPNQLVAGFPPEVDRTVIGATKERDQRSVPGSVPSRSTRPESI